MLSLWRWRYACHKNPFLCCQYCDLPTCNSAKETHLLGKLSRRKQLFWERWSDAQ